MRSASSLLSTDAVSHGARRFLARRLAEGGGVALIVGVVLIGLALASWSTRDPSINHATSGPVRNLLGARGAVLADLLTQVLGLASLALAAPIGFWGFRLIADHRLDRLKWRSAFWILGALCAAGLAAFLPTPDRWPLPTGLGGMVGDAVAAAPRRFTPGRIAQMAFAIGFGCAALLALAAACAPNRSEEDDEPAPENARRAPEVDDDAPGRLTAALGGAHHAVLLGRCALARAGARLKTFLAQARAAAPPSARAASPPRARPMSPPVRIEPQFVQPSIVRAAAPHAAARVGDHASHRDRAGDDSIFDERAHHERAHDERAFDERAFGDVPFAERAEDAPRAAAPQQSARAPAKRAKGAAAGAYRAPQLDLLSEAKKTGVRRLSQDALDQNARLLEGVLDDFGVKGEIIHVRPGPVVTLYELEPAPGVKSSRVIGLADDIARSMAAISARVAVVQGRNAIGVELPNQDRETVYLRELLAARDFEGSKHRLAIALGKTIGGEPVIVDLARMPHLLVAGTTGSGKSVAINTMILSLLYRLKPEECRLIMVDPKMLELSVYDGIPHLLTPVVTDPKKAVVALKWAVREMEERYKKMSKVGVRNIDGFNARVAEAASAGAAIVRTVQAGFDRETGAPIYAQEEMDLKPLPYIVVIVDEMADLMMVAGKDIEGAIQRLAQMARAAGIHLIMATQRPSVDVITGTIKANFPTRISFQVTSKIDSRTILGEQGAEQLLGQGDMLYMAGGGRISRVHGPFVSDAEVEKVVAHLKLQGAPEYLEDITADDEDESEGPGAAGGDYGDESADLYDRAVAIVLRDRKCSTSYIQRRLSVGYNKAASLVERMEKEGVVGQANHAGKREILVGSPERDAMGRVVMLDD